MGFLGNVCDMGAGHGREMSLLVGEFWAGCGNRPLSQGLLGEVAGPWAQVVLTGGTQDARLRG